MNGFDFQVALRRLGRHWGVSGGCSALLALVILAGITLGSLAVVRWHKACDPTPVDLAMPTGVATARLGRRRDGQPDGVQPNDPSARSASYARFSSDMQRDESISDQQRKCREKAAAYGHSIAQELEFRDDAVSGTKRDRDGLNALLAAAEAKKFNVLYFHSLSRLSRESVITLPLLKQLVYNYGVRVISVTEGIDSNDTAWELIAHIMAIVHEQYLKDLAANVFRGQEGAVLAGLCVGDYCFGFTSAPIPGSEQGRRGRNAKPRKTYIVDPETAAWVARIFHWFVHERQSLRWIARELNRLGAPKDHRATKTQWLHQYLPPLLRNRKYIGGWPWGEKQNVRDPLTGKIHQKDRPPEECQKWLRHFPHLQLIDNETFEEAQRLLKENDDVYAASRKENGKLKGSQRGASAKHPRHLLSGLVKCGHCGRTFYVGGSGGKYLFCPGYHQGVCRCQTQLRRDRAETMILNEIGGQILANPAWRELVFQETLKAWDAHEAQIPSELVAAERSLAEVEQKIANLVDRVENGQGGPELDERLTQRRGERRTLAERVERLRRADQVRPPLPTQGWVDDQLRNLGDVLSQGTPAAAMALRNLVGGQIVVTEVRRPGRARYHLRGRFTVRVSAAVQVLVGSRGGAAQDDGADVSDGGEIIIDFREPPQYEAESERAKELWDKKWLMVRIAEEMGKKKSYVRKLIKHWFESRDLPVPDGRGRRSTLEQKHQVPPMFEALAAPVETLVKEGLLISEIADRLGCCPATITKVIDYLRTTRGLSIPDGRTRRKSLNRKVSRPRRRPTDQADDDTAT
jgi:site-specific DNA recombinase